MKIDLIYCHLQMNWRWRLSRGILRNTMVELPSPVARRGELGRTHVYGGFCSTNGGAVRPSVRFLIRQKLIMFVRTAPKISVSSGARERGQIKSSIYLEYYKIA